MRLAERVQGTVTVLSPDGSIDLASASGLQERLLASIAASPKPPRIVLDLASVPFVGSAGLRALMIAAKRAQAEGGSVAVAGLRPEVVEIFRISRFDLVVKVYASVGDAVAAWGAP
jgi:anti-anti-sigma factor